MFPLIWVWINGWVNNRGAGDLRHHRGHYDITEIMRIKLVPFFAYTIFASQRDRSELREVEK